MDSDLCVFFFFLSLQLSRPSETSKHFAVRLSVDSSHVVFVDPIHSSRTVPVYGRQRSAHPPPSLLLKRCWRKSPAASVMNNADMHPVLTPRRLKSRSAPLAHVRVSDEAPRCDGGFIRSSSAEQEVDADTFINYHDQT